MKKFLKIITCLYAGMVVAHATEITFNDTNQEGPINFEVENDKNNNSIILKKVSINKASVQKLKAEEGNERIEIILKIPPMVDGRRVVIGEPKHIKGCYQLYIGAFSDLSSNDVQLTIELMGEGNNHVQLPKNCSGLFCRSDSITEISGIYSQAQVTDTQDMFMECKRLTNLDLSNFDTQNVENMRSMFRNCISLKSLDLSKFDTKKVTDMCMMFSECSNLQTLDIRNFDTKNVTDMGWMFDGCSNLQILDLSHFDTKKVTCMICMFCDCHSLQNLVLGDYFDTRHVMSKSSMFEDCNSLLHVSKNLGM